MPQDAWSPKRERQYQHIKGSLKERGTEEEKAEEIAARTVNKERASERRGGLRSHTGAKGRTYDQLRNEAREKRIPGRSKMSKAELERAVNRKG